MYIDPRIQFCDDRSRIEILGRMAIRRLRERAEAIDSDFAEYAARVCSHVPAALRLGQSGLACRACLAFWVADGDAAAADARIRAEQDKAERPNGGMTIVVDFSEVWAVPRTGPFAGIVAHPEISGFMAKVVGVKTDTRQQLGVELQVFGVADPPSDSIPITLDWLLEHGRRVS